MKKNIFVLAMFLCILLFAGCAKKKNLEKISLTLWTSAREETMTKDAVKEFIRIHKNEANLNIDVQVVEIDSVKQSLINPSGKTADIFHFASDQYTDLKNAGVLSTIDYETGRAIQESGGTSASIIREITQYGKLYAYPATNSNGYFLYYNKQYYSEEDVATLDNILSIAEKNNKYFAMDFTSGWYLYSFFAAAGKTIKVSPDGKTNVCTFNSADGNYSGVDVTNALLDIASHPAFKNVDSDDMTARLKENDIIAVVNGTWNAHFFNELWGKNCAAVKLPTYTVKNEQLQMGSFAGYKYLGVNSKCKHKRWAMKIARWLTTYKYQIRRYKTTGECPANLDAAGSHRVQISAPIAALNEQNKYATMQNLLDSYWTPMEQFGNTIAAGNPDNVDLQTLLDKTVQAIQTPTNNK